MDEATSALDYNTERQMSKPSELGKESNSSLQYSSFKFHQSGDLILVMNSGRLVEQGTHSQLMQLGQRYNALYLQQGE